LRAASHLESSIAPPAWLGHVPDLQADEVVACANGLLLLPTLTLLPHTPTFFTHNALDFAYDRDAPKPHQWLAFLDQLWPDDGEAIDTLQEVFGYCLTGDTRQQKAVLIVGPKRSGKGTIARVLRRLIGTDNTVAPTLAGLGMNFGLAALIGKRVGIISDARLGGRADQQAIAERLLSITGEDAITIDRKYLSAWTGQLQLRFIVISNELPRLADASGALASRFIVLLLTRSFYGYENPTLTYRLFTELPGILNWSIAGWRRLTQRGHFVKPRSALDHVQQLEDLKPDRRVPARAMRDRCRVHGRDQPAVQGVDGVVRRTGTHARRDCAELRPGPASGHAGAQDYAATRQRGSPALLSGYGHQMSVWHAVARVPQHCEARSKLPIAVSKKSLACAAYNGQTRVPPRANNTAGDGLDRDTGPTHFDHTTPA
jgi:P4 family phage/plasmid primase-like protien